MTWLADSLTSLAAGLGLINRDKAATAVYTPVFLTDYDLQNIYQSSWLGRKIVALPAKDSVSKRRAWQADQDDIEKIEAEEKRLNLWPKLRLAIEKGRLWGGAVIIIGDGAGNPEMPLDPNTIGVEGLRYLTIVSRRFISTPEIIWNVADPNYGKPAYYQFNGPIPQRIHPSRLVIFNGENLADPDLSDGLTWGWGQSVLQSVYIAIRNADSSIANVASLIFEANVDVFRIPDFWEALNRKGEHAKIVERFALASTIKGNNRALLIDKTEEYDRKPISFASLPEVVQTAYQLAAGAADIPATRLLGMAPAGMNSTGESDMNNYYDRILSDQENDIGPAMTVLDECIIRSALGARPEDIYYNWTPLKQMTTTERIANAKVIADTVASLTMSVLTPDVLRDSTVNQLTELGVFPGLEQDFEEAVKAGEDFDLGGDEPEVDPETGEPVATPTADATPRTLYVSRKVVNATDIVDWAIGQGFTGILPADDLHVTIMYSRTPVDWMKAGGNDWGNDADGTMTVPPGGPRLIERFGGGAVVLGFASSRLGYRHWDLREIGARSDYDEYQPHITITYDPGVLDLRSLEPYQGKIVLGPEVFAEVNENWTPGAISA